MFYERARLIGLAADVLKESLNYRPVPSDMEAGVAGLMIRSGRLVEGHELVERALAANPDDPTGLRVLADYYSAKGDWAEAEKPLLQLLKSGKPSYNLLEYLGDIAYNRRDYATAASRYREAISLNQGSASLWENARGQPGVCRQVSSGSGLFKGASDNAIDRRSGSGY